MRVIRQSIHCVAMRSIGWWRVVNDRVRLGGVRHFIEQSVLPALWRVDTLLSNSVCGSVRQTGPACE